MNTIVHGKQLATDIGRTSVQHEVCCMLIFTALHLARVGLHKGVDQEAVLGACSDTVHASCRCTCC
jgi:hypothetical protein